MYIFHVTSVANETTMAQEHTERFKKELAKQLAAAVIMGESSQGVFESERVCVYQFHEAVIDGHSKAVEKQRYREGRLDTHMNYQYTAHGRLVIDLVWDACCPNIYSSPRPNPLEDFAVFARELESFVENADLIVDEDNERHYIIPEGHSHFMWEYHTMNKVDMNNKNKSYYPGSPKKTSIKSLYGRISKFIMEEDRRVGFTPVPMQKLNDNASIPAVDENEFRTKLNTAAADIARLSAENADLRKMVANYEKIIKNRHMGKEGKIQEIIAGALITASKKDEIEENLSIDIVRIASNELSRTASTSSTASKKSSGLLAIKGHISRTASNESSEIEVNSD